MRSYESVRRLSPEAYEFLTGFDGQRGEDGHYELGGGVYANVMTCETKRRREATFEAHRKYIDIQCVIEGEELITVESLEEMRRGVCVKPYDEQADIELFGPNTDGVDVYLADGDYLILGPEQAHMPGICVRTPSRARKIVVKVPVREQTPG